MRLTQADHKFYTNVLTKLSKKGEFAWNDVVDNIKGTACEPKNWMTVRGVLQEFINEGKIHRTPDLMKERYTAL